MINEGKKKEADILIVDDVESDLLKLKELVKNAGYKVRTATRGDEAIAMARVKCPDLILLDITMPDMSGFKVCAILKKDVRIQKVPIMFVSASDREDDKVRAFQLGGVDYVTKPFRDMEMKMRIECHLAGRVMLNELEESGKRMNMMVAEQMNRVEQEKKNMLLALAMLTEDKEHVSGNHIYNIRRNCRLFAQSLQFSPKFEAQVSNDFIDCIEMASGLHDIGKIRIPDEILMKPGRLTEEEIHIMRQHVTFGSDMLHRIYSVISENQFIDMAIDIALYHHEKWDGSGYPCGLKGEEIPLAARIMRIVDTYDALTNERVYKNAYSVEKSRNIMREEAGKSFDPDMIDVFLKIYRQLSVNR